MITIVEEQISENGSSFRLARSDGVVIQGKPDGTFELRRSNGHVVSDNCLKPEKPISSLPLSESPENWHADFHQPEAPNTLRIYRLEKGICKDVQEFSFSPQTCTWHIPPPASENRGAQDLPSFSKPLNSLVSLNIGLLSLLAKLLRIVLWPIADFKWQERLKKRRLLMRLQFVGDVTLDEDGIFTLRDDDSLAPIQLRSDGSARVHERNLDPGQYKLLFKRDRTSFEYREVPWIEWLGDLLIINTSDFNEESYRVLTYSAGEWRQWRLAEPSIRRSFTQDLFASRRGAFKLVGESLSAIGKLILVIVLILLAWFCLDIFLDYLRYQSTKS